MPAVRAHLRLSLAMAGALFVAATFARIVFAFAFAPSGWPMSDAMDALWLGARFDARVAVLSMVLPWLLGSLPWAGARLRPPRARAAWLSWWMAVAAAWGLAVVFDAGHYAYLAQRLSAVIFSLARDAGEATGMVWQTYPVIRIVLGLALWLLLCHRLFGVLWRWAVADRAPSAPWRTRVAEVLVVLLAVFVVHGRASQYPLRWSDAVELPSTFAQSLALNPLQSLYDSWSFRAQRIGEAEMRPHADAVRAFVGLPPLAPGEPISFLRTVPAKPQTGAPTNVVLVLLESFAAHKTGVLGNPLGATPAFDALARDGLLFTRMMSAHSHTARGVFATVTGMPDVSRQSTASRNPAATNQHSIVNEFKGYEKYYFIGGSTTWANVRGVLNASIEGLQIYEEGRLKSPSVDVWGVSDKNLLLEANALFRAQTKPFFAIVQTSGNHRPYTIPAEDQAAFKPPVPNEAQLKSQGFISLEEFRAFAYLDWCIGRFMQQAKQEAYFQNTVFAFIGDHGIIGATGSHFPRAWQELAITQGHTPLLIYAPGRIAPRQVNHWAQQVDVLPTLASLAGIGYRNTTLGRDLLDARFDATRVAFAFQFARPGEPAVLVGQHMLMAREPVEVHDILSDTPLLDVRAGVPSLVQTWGHFPVAYDRAALYLQTHNPRLPPP